MIRRPPRSTLSSSSAASDVYKRQQCSRYQAYESFGSTSTPTQGGTWTHNSVITVTSPARTGARAIGFNATGDWIRTPMISTPGVFSFYYRRSSNTTAWSCAIETSADGTAWTSRGTISSITGSYQLYSINLGALGLTSVYVRVRDTRASGSHERYIDDMSWTSTAASENLTLPSLSSCSQTVPSGTTYAFVDQGGPSDAYNISTGQTITFSPGTSGDKVEISFSSLAGELGAAGTLYDYIEIFDGPTTASPLIGTWTSTPSGAITSSAAGGELTVRFVSDISNIYDGWIASVYTVGVPLPSELIEFSARADKGLASIEWKTASEMGSESFGIEQSQDGIEWNQVGSLPAAGNSTQVQEYQFSHWLEKEGTYYYRLRMVDFDGHEEHSWVESVDWTSKSKKVVGEYNMMGQKVSEGYEGMTIEVFEDGTAKKRLRQ